MGVLACCKKSGSEKSGDNAIEKIIWVKKGIREVIGVILLQLLNLPSTFILTNFLTFSKIVIWKAQGVPQ